MSDLTTIAVGSGAAASSPARSLARVEKPSHSNDLHDESRAQDDARDPAAARALPKPLSRSGTDGAPLWYGPRLSAPFVAQILGQVLPQAGPDALSVRAAYRKAPPALPAGLSFDSEV